MLKMPDAEYFARPEVSKSALWKFAADPDSYRPGDFGEIKQHHVTGAAFHCALLEGDTEFLSRYTALGHLRAGTESVNWGTKKFFSICEEVDAKPEFVLSKAQLEEIDGMLRSVRRNGEATALLYGDIETEVAFFWNFFGLDFKSKLDAVSLSKHRVIDIKTTRDLDTFQTDFKRYGYDWQAYIYCEAVRQYTNLTPSFSIIAVEKSGKKSSVFRVSVDTMIEAGRNVQNWICNYLRCVDAGEFSMSHCTGVVF